MNATNSSSKLAPRKKRRKKIIEGLQAAQNNKPLQEKFSDLRAELNSRVVNRDREITGLLTALLAKEHVLLLGPPGIAKSLLVKLLCKAIFGTQIFDWLLTKFSLPEELFGHFGLKAMKEDRFERVTKGKMPEANIVFLDECFKANSAILNACLKLINEREFHTGSDVIKCPLETVIGASNELPEDNTLDALYDRFLLRYWIGYLTDRDQRMQLLKSKLSPSTPMPKLLSLSDLHKAQEEVHKVTFSEDMLSLFLDVWDAIEKAGFVGSDRRYGNILHVLKAHAYLNGRSEVGEEDLVLLSHMLWKEPKDYGALCRVITKAASPTLSTANELIEAAREEFKKVPIGSDVPDHQSAQVVTQGIEVNRILTSAFQKLEQLKARKSESLIFKILDMQQEIIDMKEDVSRFVGKVGGLSL